MASRKEVAKLAGVSEATVSRVLNSVGPIKEVTRRRVVEAAEQLGYQLNAMAAGFAKGRSFNIGVVLPHVPGVHLFSTYYFSQIISGIGEAVQSAGYGLLLLYRNPGERYDYVSLFKTLRIDACLVLGASSLAQELNDLRELTAAKVPFCVIDQRYDESECIPSIGADHEHGSYVAAKRMLDAGHRRIGFLNGSAHYSNSAERLNGYRRALEEACMGLDVSLMYEGNYSRKSGYLASGQIADSLNQLDCLVCGNDRMAIGVIQGLREKGISVPDQLPIIGYDNSDAASLVDPSLTTVEVPFYEMGHQAATHLLDKLSGEEQYAASPFRKLLPTRLVIRESCGIPTSDPTDIT